MEEQTKDTKVKSITELAKDVRLEALTVVEQVKMYEYARSPQATQEEKFNEGRTGRSVLETIDDAHKALNALRMRVALQLDGRDSARARQLDRILGMSEEDTKLVDAMIDITQKVVKSGRGERDFARDLDDTLTIIQPDDEGGVTT